MATTGGLFLHPVFRSLPKQSLIRVHNYCFRHILSIFIDKEVVVNGERRARHGSGHLGSTERTESLWQRELITQT